MTEIQKLLEIMRALRDPETGCPWDRQQTFKTIAPYTIEEAYEVADAIETDDMDELRSELGDLLLQVVYHAQMADEENHFNFTEVVACINKKLVDRHPHVFGSVKIDTAEAQSKHWESIKVDERKTKAESSNHKASVLDGISLNMPALCRAQKLQVRAAQVGFDWDDIQSVFASTCFYRCLRKPATPQPTRRGKLFPLREEIFPSAATFTRPSPWNIRRRSLQKKGGVHERMASQNRSNAGNPLGSAARTRD